MIGLLSQKYPRSTGVIETAVVICCLLFYMRHYTSAFDLEATPRQLTFAPEESFTLHCSHSKENTFIESEIVEVREMRLTKRIDKRGWQTVSEIIFVDQEKYSHSGEDLIGLVGKKKESFLKAVWYDTLIDILGVYRCDIVGINENNVLVLEQTNLVTIFAKNTTTKDMLLASEEHLNNLQLEGVQDNVENQSNKVKATSLDLIQQLRKEMQEYFKVLQANTANATTCGCQESKTTVAGKAEGSSSRQESGKVERIKPSLPTTTMSTADPAPEAKVDDERRSEAWPDQTFGLPMPESGCPATPGGATWLNGHIGYHTESVDENRDNVSYPNHLTGPVNRVDDQGNHFMYLHFCVKDSYYRTFLAIFNVTGNQSKEEATGPIQWPAGSYCINRAGGRCPRGFSSGYLDIDEEDTGHIRKVKAPLPDVLFFCCRKDGPATNPVRLPAQNPFFLYRFGGKCQAVLDMQVRAESVTLDTENVNNSDGYENEFHPDGHVEDVRLELCYYSQ